MKGPKERGASPHVEGGLAPAERPRRGLTLGVFAKHWTPGETKTRLAAAVGPESAAQLSRCFLETTLERLTMVEKSVARRVVVYAPAARGEAFERLPPVAAGVWRHEPQSTGDLGARMRAYFEGASPALLCGSDSPDLPLDGVSRAAEWLAEAEGGRRLVLGPSEDGGYWLIGLRGELPPIFDNMPWSDPSLLEVTLGRLAAAGWVEGTDYRLVDRWYDVDDARDLARLRSSLRAGDSSLSRLADQIDVILRPDSR